MNKGNSYDHLESYHKFMDVNLFDHIDIDKNNTHVPMLVLAPRPSIRKLSKTS